MRGTRVGIALLSLCGLLGCQGLASGDALARNVVVTNDVRMEMKWCSLSDAREVECELEMTSLFQDRRAGLAYPKLQDQRGQEYRLQSELMKLMVADQPYVIRLTASNLSTAATEVRSIVGTMVTKTPDGVHRIAQQVVTFSGIPKRPAAATATSAPAAATSSDTGRAAPTPTTPANVPGAYFFGRIVPVTDVGPENDIMRLWDRGAYLHMREDGILGFNWSEPSGYAYLDLNRWSLAENTLTLDMSGARYHFDLDSPNPPLEAFLDPGGAFQMSLQPKKPMQR